MEKFSDWVDMSEILDEAALHQRNENDLYGETFEKLVVNALGGKVELTYAERNLIEPELVQMAVKALKKRFVRRTTVVHTGSAVKNSNGDIEINGKAIEVKFVATDKGTYYNTSTEFFNKVFGLDSYTMTDKYFKPVRDYLAKIYGDSVYSGISPLTKEQAKEMQDDEKLHEIEMSCRRKYVSYLTKYFSSHPEECSKLYDVIITKQNSNKKPPKYYLVCRYNRKRCDLYETKDLIDDVKNFSFTENMTQFFIGNIVVKVGWQNGVGFNPSVRCKFR